jgi:hypothetical protein
VNSLENKKNENLFEKKNFKKLNLDKKEFELWKSYNHAVKKNKFDLQKLRSVRLSEDNPKHYYRSLYKSYIEDVIDHATNSKRKNEGNEGESSR